MKTYNYKKPEEDTLIRFENCWPPIFVDKCKIVAEDSAIMAIDELPLD